MPAYFPVAIWRRIVARVGVYLGKHAIDGPLHHRVGGKGVNIEDIQEFVYIVENLKITHNLGIVVLPHLCMSAKAAEANGEEGENTKKLPVHIHVIRTPSATCTYCEWGITFCLLEDYLQ